MDVAERSRDRLSGAVALLALLLVIATAWTSPSAAAPRPTRAALNPEFVAYQEELATMAVAREATEDGRALGLIPNPVDLSHMTGLVPATFADRTPRGFPATYDLRTLGRVTAIRDQGPCGSCWSFAGIASLESWLLTSPAETWNLSENNLKECHGFDWGACDGGNSSMVTAYLARRDGPVRETDDPYRAYPVGCTSGLTVRKFVRDVLYFPDRSGSLDNDVLKQAITTYGAISTDLYWTSGSYKSATRAYYYSGSSGANHAVDLVGWNDAYSRTNFQSTPAGNGAWIVRNSWGAGWGDAGYFYVSYYDTRIGQSNVAFVNAVEPDGTTLCQYDPLGWITNWGYGSTTAWGANAFTASAAGEIRSVGTYASTVNTSYQVLIKSSLNGSTLATKTGTWPLAGYHTVDLDLPVAVAAGQSFVVAVRYTTPNYYYPIPAECYQAGYSSGATAGPGQSYISEDGASWDDITTNWWGDSTCNMCIKAVMGPASFPPSEEPVGYWRMNEGSGTTTADASDNGNTGTLSGAAWASGSPDSTTALAFDGIDDYVQIANSPSLNPTSALTLEAWIRPNAVTAGRQVAILEKAYSSPAAPYYQYCLVTYGTEFLLYLSVNGQLRYVVSSGAGLAAGTWQHVAALFDGANIRLYVNGVLKGSGNVGAGTITAYNTPVLLGKHKDYTTERWNGSIDEVRIHNRVLDPAEFNLPPSGPVPTPPALVSNFTASDGADAQSTLAWTNPADTDLAQVVVQRKTGSYPTSHTDGTNVYDNASPTPSAPVSTPNTGLTNLTTYYYAVFSRDADGAWNEAVTAGSNADTATPSAAAGGPVGYWRLNEGSGSTTADSSGNGNTGTISGAAWVPGSPDATTALAFDGIDDYVQIANSPSLNPTSALTLEAWIRPNAVTAGRQVAILEKAYSSPAAPYYQYCLVTYGTEFLLYLSVNGQLRYVVSSGAGLAAGTWQHVAALFDGASIRLYVNGVLKGSGNVGAGTITAYNTPLLLGKHKDYTTERWNGSIDEVRIHNRALDPAEFNLPPSGPVPTPPALVSNFTASDGADAQSVLAWTNPADADLGQVVVQRKTGSYPTSHTDGTSVYDNASPTPSAPVSTPNTGLTNLTTYYYAVFTRDADGAWNEAVTAGSNADTATPSAAAGGPVGYWRLNEGSGSTTADSSGNGNTGTISGAAWVPGSPDATTALAFDGIDDYVQIANSPSLNPTSALTIEAWIRPNAVTAGRQVAILEKAYSSPAAPYYQYCFATYGTELLLYLSVNGQLRYVVSSGAGLAAGTWQHVAALFDGANIRLYVNGVLKGSGNVGAGTITAYNTPLLFGKHKDYTTERWNGSIDEVRIHNRALNPAEFNLLPTGGLSPESLAPSALRVRVVPNPFSDSAVFEVWGGDVESVAMRIFDLAGRLLLDSGWHSGATVAWSRETDDGERVANGVYLCAVRVRLSGGMEIALRPQTVFVLAP